MSRDGILNHLTDLFYYYYIAKNELIINKKNANSLLFVAHSNFLNFS